MIVLLAVVATVIALTALGVVTARRQAAANGDATPVMVDGGDAGGHGCHDTGLGGCDVGGHH